MSGPTSRDGHLPARRSGADRFTLGAFLGRWSGCAHQDLAASDSQTLALATLLQLADDQDMRRWDGIDLGYADPRGAPWLRAAIAARDDGLSPEHILACNGAQEGINCVLRALLEPGDHAVVVVPIYQPSEIIVTGLCAASGVALDPGAGWHLDLGRAAGAIRPNTRLVLANFPNSPTGATLGRGALDDLVALCRRSGLWLVNDEVYRQTQVGEIVPPVAERYERGVSINGLSKGFGLPGLRVGWVACRDRSLVGRALAQKNLLSSCLSGPSEVLAGIAVRMEARIVAAARSIGEHNHGRLRLLIERFPDLLESDNPGNLAFAFPRYRGSDGATGFAEALARRAGLVVLPSELWRSSLAAVPLDRLRLGLGRAGSATALEVLEAHLVGPWRRQGWTACTA